MKVGDLVKRNRSTIGGAAADDLGIVISMEHYSEEVALISWGNYGTFWTRVSIFEVISESR